MSRMAQRKTREIMDTIDKLRIIESDAVPKEGAKIENFGTSIKITHSCGCVLAEHFACGTPTTVRKEESPEIYGRLLAERKYHIELCKEHNPI